ncbi:uncharacterized protein LOC135499791 [Lineus longissimus]|uniref:uncharacterized protein LOC135499791 n=1 Tax=Lineus longissimus TaxID=88925 RepID=UPI00315CE3DC
MSSAKKIGKTSKKKTQPTPMPEIQRNGSQKQHIFSSTRRDVPSITVEEPEMSATAFSSGGLPYAQVQSDNEVIYHGRTDFRQHSLPNHQRPRERPKSESVMYYERNQGPRIYQSVRSRSADHLQTERHQSMPRAVSHHAVRRSSKKQAVRSHSDSEQQLKRNAERKAVRTYSEGDKGRWLEEQMVETKSGNEIPKHRTDIKGLSLDDLQLDIRPGRFPQRPVTATLGHNFRGQIISPEGIRNGFMNLGPGRDSVRSGTLGRRKKEDAITYFAIRFVNNDTHVYHPGETVEGHVIMDTSWPLTALGIDLIIRARGSLTVCKEGVVSHRKSELYLEKTSRMLGRNDGRMIMITPGHYISTFTYQLPKKLPSSILSENTLKNISFKLDVSYTAQAVIFDEMYAKATSNTGSPHVTHGIHMRRGDNYRVVAKPIKVATKQFKVVSIPDAPLTSNFLKPANHTEYLSNNDGLILAMESTIVYPGSEVEMHMDVDEGTVKLVKGIKVELEQQIQIPNTHHDIRRTMKETVHDPAMRKRNGTLVTWDITMKMPNSLTPTYKEIINLVIVEYSLLVTLKLPSKQLLMRVPIEVRRIPTAKDHTATMPDFRMATRFSNLSDAKPKEIENGYARPEEVKVQVEYRYNSWIRRNSKMYSCFK